MCAQLTSLQSGTEDILIVLGRAIPALVPELMLTLLNTLWKKEIKKTIDILKWIERDFFSFFFLRDDKKTKEKQSCYVHSDRLDQW